MTCVETGDSVSISDKKRLARHRRYDPDQLVEHRQKFGNEEIAGTTALVHVRRTPRTSTSCRQSSVVTKGRGFPDMSHQGFPQVEGHLHIGFALGLRWGFHIIKKRDVSPIALA